MKKIIWSTLFLLFAAILYADPLYLADSLVLELNVQGSFDLIAEKPAAKLQEVTADLLLFPQIDFRQELVTMETTGQRQQNKVAFAWNDQAIEGKKFGYSAQVRTQNKRVTVSQKNFFPLSPAEIQGFEQYLQPTTTIDSNDQTIIAQATKLAEGEDDLFKVVFKIANWVDENVNYDLTTLTAETSQKASWVLENKRGVCDEMTSLFVAMLRSLGIPARFVSGVSYTTSDLFDYPWQPHGWAEVYFPDIGWVSFDITFGEYGYVDVTHVKLRDGFDPQEPATRFEWVAQDVDLKTEKLEVTARVVQQGPPEEEEVQLEQEILTAEAGFGSYNLIKGILKNKANYYAASTLKVAVPAELEIIGKNKRTLLLAPKEVRETYWVVKVPPNLDEKFIYTFPVLMYSEKNVSVSDQFTVQSGKQYYSQADIENLLVKDEEKTYSRKIAFSCDYPRQIKLNQPAKVRCIVKNTGNANLQDLNFCLEGVCDLVDLPINQEQSAAITLKADTVGWNKVIVSAENGLVEKKSVLEYQVLDDPRVTVVIDYPETVILGESVPLTIKAEKASYSEPRELVIMIKGLAQQHKIEVEALEKDHSFQLELNSQRLTHSNWLQVTTTWKDQEGESYASQQMILIRGEAAGPGGKLRLWWNKVVVLLYGQRG
ncbi:MAG: transglutaminase-like domain-containing protein [Nanoarchaeota archaeon]